MDRLIEKETNRYAKRFYITLKENGYRLREGELYEKAKKKIDLICPKGHIYRTSPDVFNRGYRCSTCAGNKKRTHGDFVRLIYELTKEGYTVLGKYVNNVTPVLMRHNNEGCENYEWKVRPGDFITKGYRCPKCSGRARKNTEIYYNEVKELTNGEYELIDEYINSDKPVMMRHNNPDCNYHEWKCAPYNFLIGNRCPRCSKPRGEKSPHYDPTIPQEEREKGRWLYSADLAKWRREVYFRDDFTCQSCFDKNKNNLNAHHLNGYHWDKENRFNIDNGVTLCEECHEDFHKKYGKRNNTKEQFEEYTKMKLQHT